MKKINKIFIILFFITNINLFSQTIFKFPNEPKNIKIFYNINDTSKIYDFKYEFIYYNNDIWIQFNFFKNSSFSNGIFTKYLLSNNIILEYYSYKDGVLLDKSIFKKIENKDNNKLLFAEIKEINNKTTSNNYSEYIYSNNNLIFFKRYFLKNTNLILTSMNKYNYNLLNSITNEITYDYYNVSKNIFYTNNNSSLINHEYDLNNNISKSFKNSNLIREYKYEFVNNKIYKKYELYYFEKTTNTTLYIYEY